MPRLKPTASGRDADQFFELKHFPVAEGDFRNRLPTGKSYELTLYASARGLSAVQYQVNLKVDGIPESTIGRHWQDNRWDPDWNPADEPDSVTAKVSPKRGLVTRRDA